MSNGANNTAVDNLSVTVGEIKQLKNAYDIDRMLLSGFIGGRKTVSEDGTVITSVDTSGFKLTKTFTNNFTKCTTVLSTSENVVIATLVKTFSADGRDIDSVVTYASA